MNVYLGFDISTTNVGLTILNENGTILLMKHFSLVTSKKIVKDVRLFIKANAFEKIVQEIKLFLDENNSKVCGLFVEEPLIASNNVFTASLLQKFNGIASYILYKIFNFDVEFISVHDSRKYFCPEFVNLKIVKGEPKHILSFPKGLDKKMYILKKISSKYKDIKWIYDKNNNIKTESFDISDSFCVVYSKLIEKNILKPL